ncbi:M6 family metalloprotease domain-containing protein [Natronospora cellulosivora (SeqCode)]
MFKSKFRSSVFAVTVVLLVLVMLSGNVLGAPVYEEEMMMRQPNGAEVMTIVTGDEYYLHVESIDGYTLVEDEYGWLSYAYLSEDGNELLSTGIRYWGDEINDLYYNNQEIPKHIQISNEALREKINKAIEELHGHETEMSTDSGEVYGFSQIMSLSVEEDPGIMDRIPLNPVSGEITGLTVVVDFSDTNRQEYNNYDYDLNDVRDLMNGFDGEPKFGINGSVKDYFHDMSGGELILRHEVLGYYDAGHSDQYKTRSDVKKLIDDVIDYVKENHVDVLDKISTETSSTGREEIVSFNILYTGPIRGSWGVGLWPHKSSYRKEIVDGIYINDYMISHIGYWGFSGFGTICHELGHSVLGYPDLYVRDDGFGVGAYCLMSSSGGKNPPPLSPYLRSIVSGWGEVIKLNDMIGEDAPNFYTDTNGNSKVFLWENPTNNKEYILIEGINPEGRYANFPEEGGLLIWHVDETGNNIRSKSYPDHHYLVSVVQADGNFDLEKGNSRIEASHFFREDDHFGHNSKHPSRWRDGSYTGLGVSQISRNFNEDLETLVYNFTIRDKEAVEFEDEQLSRLLKYLTRKYNGIYIQDLWDMDSLYATGLSSLEGIEYLVNLEELRVEHGNVSDISQIAYLPHLSYISFWDNQVEDISVLSNFDNIEYLNLNDNNISDISSLRTFYKNRNKTLHELELDPAKNNLAPLDCRNENYITYIELNLHGAIDFDIKVNIEDDNFRSIIREKLDIKDGEDIFGTDLHDLKYLDISGEGIKSLEGIELFPSIIQLNADDNEISDLSILANTNLMLYQLNNNNISDVGPLLELANLDKKWIELENNPFTLDGYRDLLELEANARSVRITNRPGDVNGDGVVDEQDIALLRDYIMGVVSEDEIVFENADVNNDGVINTDDNALLRRFLNGL